jgi:hypothetical protein
VGCRQAKDSFVDRCFFLGVIENEKVGEFLLIQFARNFRQRKQAFWHRRKGEESRGPAPHDDVESKVIANERENTATGIPDCDGEWTTERRPDRIAAFLPRGEHNAGIGPCRALNLRQAD